VVVVAAGNWAIDASNVQPANCTGVITVAATNRTGGEAWYTDFGSTVEIAAPGGDTEVTLTDGVLSTLNAGVSSPGADIYEFYQGTSMATPHVTGIVALMLSRNPTLSPDQVLTILQQTARPFPAVCSGCGAGIANAAAAVQASGGGLTPAQLAAIQAVIDLLIQDE
jgi:serine protease